MDKYEAFKEGLKKVQHRYKCLRLDVDWITVVAVIACIQLSLRHPGNTGGSSVKARAFVESIIDHIGAISPDLADILRQGFDPQHDL
jgi:hypothetical protein